MSYGYYPYRSLKACLGTRIEECRPPNVYSVSYIHIHPKYTWGNRANNIALVELRRKVDKAIARPIPALFDKGEVPGGKASLIAWDVYSSYWGNHYQLYRFDVLIYEREQCKRTYEQGNQKLADDQICTEHFSTPYYTVSQSGQPLVDFECQRMIGIYVGNDYSYYAYPTVYTSVGYHRDWINKIISAKKRILSKKLPNSAYKGNENGTSEAIVSKTNYHLMAFVILIATL